MTCHSLLTPVAWTVFLVLLLAADADGRETTPFEGGEDNNDVDHSIGTLEWIPPPLAELLLHDEADSHSLRWSVQLQLDERFRSDEKILRIGRQKARSSSSSRSPETATEACVHDVVLAVLQQETIVSLMTTNAEIVDETASNHPTQSRTARIPIDLSSTQGYTTIHVQREGVVDERGDPGALWKRAPMPPGMYTACLLPTEATADPASSRSSDDLEGGASPLLIARGLLHGIESSTWSCLPIVSREPEIGSVSDGGDSEGATLCTCTATGQFPLIAASNDLNMDVKADEPQQHREVQEESFLNTLQRQYNEATIVYADANTISVERSFALSMPTLLSSSFAPLCPLATVNAVQAEVRASRQLLETSPPPLFASTAAALEHFHMTQKGRSSEHSSNAENTKKERVVEEDSFRLFRLQLVRAVDEKPVRVLRCTRSSSTDADDCGTLLKNYRVYLEVRYSSFPLEAAAHTTLVAQFTHRKRPRQILWNCTPIRRGGRGGESTVESSDGAQHTFFSCEASSFEDSSSPSSVDRVAQHPSFAMSSLMSLFQISMDGSLVDWSLRGGQWVHRLGRTPRSFWCPHQPNSSTSCGLVDGTPRWLAATSVHHTMMQQQRRPALWNVPSTLQFAVSGTVPSCATASFQWRHFDEEEGVKTEATRDRSLELAFARCVTEASSALFTILVDSTCVAPGMVLVALPMEGSGEGEEIVVGTVPPPHTPPTHPRAPVVPSQEEQSSSSWPSFCADLPRIALPSSSSLSSSAPTVLWLRPSCGGRLVPAAPYQLQLSSVWENAPGEGDEEAQKEEEEVASFSSSSSSSPRLKIRVELAHWQRPATARWTGRVESRTFVSLNVSSNNKEEFQQEEPHEERRRESAPSSSSGASSTAPAATLQIGNLSAADVEAVYEGRTTLLVTLQFEETKSLADDHQSPRFVKVTSPLRLQLPVYVLPHITVFPLTRVVRLKNATAIGSSGGTLTGLYLQRPKPGRNGATCRAEDRNSLRMKRVDVHKQWSSAEGGEDGDYATLDEDWKVTSHEEQIVLHAPYLICALWKGRTGDAQRLTLGVAVLGVAPRLEVAFLREQQSELDLSQTEPIAPPPPPSLTRSDSPPFVAGTYWAMFVKNRAELEDSAARMRAKHVPGCTTLRWDIAQMRPVLVPLPRATVSPAAMEYLLREQRARFCQGDEAVVPLQMRSNDVEVLAQLLAAQGRPTPRSTRRSAPIATVWVAGTVAPGEYAICMLHDNTRELVSIVTHRGPLYVEQYHPLLLPPLTVPHVMRSTVGSTMHLSLSVTEDVEQYIFRDGMQVVAATTSSRSFSSLVKPQGHTQPSSSSSSREDRTKQQVHPPPPPYYYYPLAVRGCVYQFHSPLHYHEITRPNQPRHPERVVVLPVTFFAPGSYQFVFGYLSCESCGAAAAGSTSAAFFGRVAYPVEDTTSMLQHAPFATTDPHRLRLYRVLGLNRTDTVATPTLTDVRSIVTVEVTVPLLPKSAVRARWISHSTLELQFPKSISSWRAHNRSVGFCIVCLDGGIGSTSTPPYGDRRDEEEEEEMMMMEDEPTRHCKHSVSPDRHLRATFRAVESCGKTMIDVFAVFEQRLQLVPEDLSAGPSRVHVQRKEGPVLRQYVLPVRPAVSGGAANSDSQSTRQGARSVLEPQVAHDATLLPDEEDDQL